MHPDRPDLDRRQLLTAALAAAALAGCSSSPSAPSADSTATSRPPVGSSPTTGAGAAPGLDGGGVPEVDTILDWIDQIVSQGVRRPGYSADIWTEDFVAEQLRAIGVKDVHLEPVPLTRWEPIAWSLVATPEGDEPSELSCFPLPYGAPVEGLDVELVAFDPDEPGPAAGRAALVDARVLRLPPTAAANGGSAPSDLTGRIYDPDDSFASEEHVLPHTLQRNRVVDPVVDAGAAAFVGTLLDYPGDGHQYFVPYHGEPLPLPGVWISGTDGRWLHEQLARGRVRVRLDVESTSTAFESHNLIGQLPGRDDEVVLIGSHHDAPWASAVEDGTGIGMVLAQATYWAAQPVDKRPHRLRFLLHGGHMCGGAGLDAYLEAHGDELDDVVLEVHLEHAALDVEDRGGTLEPTGRCVPRWFFTSRNPDLETAVSTAIEAEDLRRSMLVAPDALGARPPTDGARFHEAGLPIVQFLAAPWYLFDEADTLDKIDRDNLVPITRAVIRIIEATAGVSAAQMRAGLLT